MFNKRDWFWGSSTAFYKHRRWQTHFFWQSSVKNSSPAPSSFTLRQELNGACVCGFLGVSAIDIDKRKGRKTEQAIRKSMKI